MSEGLGDLNLNKFFSVKNLLTKEAPGAAAEFVWDNRGNIAGALLGAGIGTLAVTGVAQAQETTSPTSGDQDWVLSTIQVLKTISVPTLVGAGNVARVRWLRGIEKTNLASQIQGLNDNLEEFKDADSETLARDAVQNGLNFKNGGDVEKYRDAILKQVSDSLEQAKKQAERYSSPALLKESVTEFLQGYFATVLVFDVFNTIERAWTSANLGASLSETIDQGQKFIAWIYGATALVQKAWELQNSGGGVAARSEKATKHLRREGKIK